MDRFQMLMPTKVIFGAGVFDQLADVVGTFGCKPLIVTGRLSARDAGTLDRVMAQLPDAVVFDQVKENPDTATCARAAAMARENGCDVIVAIGGGSAMDAAKAAAVLAKNPKDCRAYFGTHSFPGGCLPVVAVPTTAGTGSEMTPYAVLVDEEAETKRTLSGETLFPRVALLDPELTLSLPRQVTVNTGLDVLSQAMEGIVSLKATPFSDFIGLQCCRIVREWLPRAVAHGGDLEARSQMLYAAMLSGIVIAHTGTTLVHGMGYYLTLEFGIAHGLANGLLLTPVFEYNAREAPGKVAAIAEALGHPSPATPDAAATAIRSAIKTLFESVGQSPAAKNAGAAEHRLDGCAEALFNDRGRFKNQIGSPSLEDVRGFFRQAFWGGHA
jgi:alcohol dehydrogenase class IV